MSKPQSSSNNAPSSIASAAQKRTAVGSRPSRWQLLVIPSATAATKLNALRFDDAHEIKSPHAQLGWSHQVGWHNPISASGAINASDLVSSRIHEQSILDSDSHRLKAPKFLLRSQPQNQKSDYDHSSTKTDIDNRLLELANQLATDIREPLMAAYRIVNKISHQVRFDSYLSIDDADLLAAASSKLDLVAQWADSILLTKNAHAQALEIVRTRFTPEQWMKSIQETLQSIAHAKRIKLNWIGWETELPCLYLDPNHLTNAAVNLVASAVAASEIGSTINLRVNWQNNVTQRLMITIEDSGISLPANLMKILNSTSVETLVPIKGIGLQTARQLITSIGGIVAAQHGSRGGTVVRFSLPVDTYASMIRAWILQNATAGSAFGLHRISLFAIRCGQSQADDFNVHLQKSSTNKQFVYRVASNRWLVLELKANHERSDSTLMAVAERYVPIPLQASQPWLSQSILNTQEFALERLLGRSDHGVRLPQLTEQLVAKFSELLNHQQPQIDKLSINGASITAPVISRQIRELELDIEDTHTVDDASTSTPAPKSRILASDQQPGAKTVSEIVKQWKQVQAKLAMIGSFTSSKPQQPMTNA